MSPDRGPWTGKDTWECVGMLAMTAGALAAWTGHLSIDDMRVYAQTATDLAIPVALGAVGTVAALAVLLVAVRYLRVAMVAAARTYWLYRRRWATALERLDLTETTPAGTKVPRITGVQRVGHEDIVSVRMLKGQSAGTYHERSAALAAEFGASAARVRFGKQPHRDVVIAFDRTPQVQRREQLALPAPQPPLFPLHALKPLPQQQPEPRRAADPRVAIRISGVQLRIVWARAIRTGHDGTRAVRIPVRSRFGLRGEMRWATTWATSL